MRVGCRNSSRLPPRASITTLSRHFGFDAVETEGVIRFVMRGRASVATLAPDGLVAAREGDVPARLVVVLPAAGLPWFLTVFGRDTLITAYQSVSYGPLLARGALLELASMQGKECNDFKDEEPGRIMHEIRQGELTLLGLKPHSPYYGTSDATMLWLILLSEYWRWTCDNALMRRLEPNARAHAVPDGHFPPRREAVGGGDAEQRRPACVLIRQPGAVAHLEAVEAVQGDAH